MPCIQPLVAGACWDGLEPPAVSLPSQQPLPACALPPPRRPSVSLWGPFSAGHGGLRRGQDAGRAGTLETAEGLCGSVLPREGAGLVCGLGGGGRAVPREVHDLPLWPLAGQERGRRSHQPGPVPRRAADEAVHALWVPPRACPSRSLPPTPVCFPWVGSMWGWHLSQSSTAGSRCALCP